MLRELAPNARYIASDQTWIDGESLEQLKLVAAYPGMLKAVGMPDLHPGKGSPIGAAFLSRGMVYPPLVGNDVGCGMGLWATGLTRRKAKRDRWAARLHGLESPWDGDREAWLAERGVDGPANPEQLGTIGGGNHFAELQVVEKVLLPEAAAGIAKDDLLLLVHSGSRGLGEAILDAHREAHGEAGLADGTPALSEYLRGHDQAMRWAEANRALIAHRFLEQIGGQGARFFDHGHNHVKPVELADGRAWLHRKGASPSDAGLSILPGSRGSRSYLILPKGDGAVSAWSLAHGAGRKWKRREVKDRLIGKYDIESLRQTELGSLVICEDKDLLYEEAPQAYKNVDQVVQDLVEAGLAEIVAVTAPLITYKVRREED